MSKHEMQGNKMGIMSTGRLLLNMALPLISAMLVQALYNVVDSIYISRVSESAVTALGLAFPIQNLLIGFATGVGVGVNSLLSKSLGEADSEKANRCAGNGILLSIASFVLFLIFGLFFSKPYFAMQSSVAETVEGGADYLMICCVFSLGIFVEVLFERLLQASGRTFYSMITQGVGAVVNILLDPVLIFGWFGLPAMGMAGAAIATVIGQWIAAVLAVIFNFRFNPDVRLSLHGLKPDGALIRGILGIGVPSIIMVGIGSVMNFGMNQILQGFSETATGVFSVYFKLQSFFFMPVFGLNNATISILAFNYGARKPDRITETLKRASIIALGIMLVGLAVFQFLPDLLLSIFHPTAEFLRMGRSALRIISVNFPVAAVCIVLGASFQALGDGIYSTITALCRQLLVLLPAAWLLSFLGDVNYVWLAFPIAEVASLLVTVLLFVRIYRRKIRPLYQK